MAARRVPLAAPTRPRAFSDVSDACFQVLAENGGKPENRRAIHASAQLTIDQLPSRRRVFGFGGGSVSLAEKDGLFCVVLDESTMASLLDEEDLQGKCLVHIIEFDADAERLAYLNKRFLGAGADGTL